MSVFAGTAGRIAALAAALVLTDRAQPDDKPVRLAIRPTAPTDVDYSIDISGEVITPSVNSQIRLPLKSEGSLRFRNLPYPTQLGGPFTLRAVRRYESASTQTIVGKDHLTKVSLPTAWRTVHVYGSEKGLTQVSPKYALPRKQLDLLAMPFDVLITGSLLPSTDVSPGDRWNTDAWIVPALTGIDAVVKQSAACTLEELTAEQAVISVSGEIEGAVQGSAADISFSGRMTFSRANGIVKSLTVTQKEKRSPGPVSPGLDVTARISWTQKPAEAGEKESALTTDAPPENQLQLFLQTPMKLQLRHSREWHLFHETPNVTMLRQLRDGNLISQCNIAPAVTVPPKQHTPDQEFLTDVEEAVLKRKGKVVKQGTIRDDGRWRIRHIQAVGSADEQIIVWDYYLCTAVSGEQFSVIFSHSRSDDEKFADEGTKILSTLQIAGRRPALPFR